MKSQNIVDLSDFKTQLQRIFVYYCSFADKQSFSLLKIQNYRRFILDLQLPQNSTLSSQLDLVFFSHSQSNTLSLQSFTNSLPQLASLFFLDIQEEARLLKLLSMHIQPLYDQIIKDTELGQATSYITASLLKEQSFVFLKKFQEGLLALWKVYFNEEGKAGKQQEVKMFFKLSRELNLVPRVTSKPVSYLIFDFLRQKCSRSAFQVLFANAINQNPKKYTFNFVCFIEYLIILSHINTKTEEKEQLKLYRLLQLIEVSAGCQQLATKQKFKHFYLTDKQLQEALQEKITPIVFNSSKSPVIQSKSIGSPLKKKLVQYFEPLNQKFIELCSKRQVENNFYLPAWIAKRLLQRICPSLTGMSIELLIASVGRINFEHFIILLEKSAKKIGLYPQTLYEQVLLFDTENYSLNLILQNLKLSKRQEITCRQILRHTQGYIRSLYDFYQTRGNLTLSAYTKMFHEVGVIPSIMSQIQATQIYKVSSNQSTKMNLVQFQESFLAIIMAVHFAFELEGAERLIYLLQKISQSKRGEALMKKNLLMVREHPMHMLRLNYSNTYQEIQKKLEFNTRSVLVESKNSEGS